MSTIETGAGPASPSPGPERVRKRERPASGASSKFAFPGFAAFLLILALAPLWYGSVPTAPRIFMAIALVMTGFFMVLRHLSNGEGFAISASSVKVPLVCCLLVSLWALAQAFIPVSPGIGDLVWPLAGEGLQMPVPVHISGAPADTLLAVFTLVLITLVFVIAEQFGSDPLRAIAGLRTISLVAAGYAVWGLVDHFVGWNMVLYEAKDRFSVANLGGYVSSTFRNADHFADFCVIGLACTASLLLRDLRRMQDKLSLGSNKLADFAMPSLDSAILAILGTALWLSRSRAGIATALLTMLVVFIIAAVRLYRAGKRGMFFAILAAALLGIVALTGVALESQAGFSRISTLGQSASTRWLLYRTIGSASLDNPLFGTGFGAFRDAFTVYRTSDLGFGAYWNSAHNIYLEAVFGLGYPMAFVLFAGVGWVVWRVMSGAIIRRQHVAAPTAACAALVGLLVHGLVDYGLQVPAVAVVLAALAGFGCAQSWSSRKT